MGSTTKKAPIKTAGERKSAGKAAPSRGAKSGAGRSSAGGKASGKSRVKLNVTAEERQRMIALAAYVRAEKRGFAGGDAVDDWLKAEAEVDALLAGVDRKLATPEQRA